MAVDHGLGGKDSVKSRQRRAKKAKRTAMVAKSSLTKKGEVIFNENARVDFLTGFRKRKQERRKFGLAMQVINEKKERSLKRKELRTAVKSVLTIPDLNNDDDDNNIDANGDVVETPEVFEDELTRQMFGGAVSVVVDTGIADQMDAAFIESSADAKNRAANSKEKWRRKEPTKLERAMKIAQKKLNAPKKKKSLFQKSEGTKLLHKAMGSGKLGDNTYKKNSKSKRGRK